MAVAATPKQTISSTDSFVTNLLATAGRLEKEDLTTKLTQLSRRVDEIKLDVHEALQKKYEDFYPSFDATRALIARVGTIEEEMQTLSESFDKQIKGQVRISSSEYETLFVSCEESKATVFLLTKLIAIDEAIHSLTKIVERAAVGGCQNYVQATTLIENLNEMFAELNESYGKGLLVLPSLILAVSIERKHLETCLVDKWNVFIRWMHNDSYGSDKQCDNDDDEVDNDRFSGKVEVTFVSSTKKAELLEVTQAMFNMSLLESYIRSFATRLMNRVVRPCLTAPRSYAVDVRTTDSGTSLVVKMHLNSDKEADVTWKQDDTLHAFKHLQTIIQVLHDCLGGISFLSKSDGTLSNDNASNHGVQKQTTLMHELGEVIREELVTILINQSLTPSIPTSPNELISYQQVIDATKLLEANLIEAQFLSAANAPNTSMPLTDYVANITTLFVNKKCERLLERARKLMMSPLYNVVLVGAKITAEDQRNNLNGGHLDLPGEFGDVGAPPKKERKVGVGAGEGRVVDDSGSDTHQSLFNFPQCQISVSVKELVSIAYETLYEASTYMNSPSESSSKSSTSSAGAVKTSKSGHGSSKGISCQTVSASERRVAVRTEGSGGVTFSPECAIQLFYAVRNMFELYISVVPVYHKEQITTLPLIAAVHHNDAMYITHHLMLLAHQFRSALPPPLSTGGATFIDLIPVVRRLAIKTLMDQLALESSQLNQFFSVTHGFVSISETGNYEPCERAVKQSLLQLRHLGAVWREVLPSNVYSKAIGSLLNSVIAHIVTSITSLEDISEKDADCLHSILSLIIQAGPEIIRADVTTTVASIPIARHCVSWNLLNQLMFVLKSSLVEISEGWADKRLSTEFTATQIKQLIRALFQNTEKRAAILLAIK